MNQLNTAFTPTLERNAIEDHYGPLMQPPFSKMRSRRRRKSHTKKMRNDRQPIYDFIRRIPRFGHVATVTVIYEDPNKSNKSALSLQ